MPKTVGVAVSNATFHFDKLYTYAVMPDQQDAVRLGSMVLVPFGRGSRARMGVVLACDAEPENSKLKFLFDVAPASAPTMRPSRPSSRMERSTSPPWQRTV